MGLSIDPLVNLVNTQNVILASECIIYGLIPALINFIGTYSTKIQNQAFYVVYRIWIEISLLLRFMFHLLTPLDRLNLERNPSRGFNYTLNISMSSLSVACLSPRVLLASQSPYPIIVYSLANYRPHLSHFWAIM